MSGKDSDDDERPTQTAIGGNHGDWHGGIHLPHDTERPTKLLPEDRQVPIDDDDDAMAMVDNDERRTRVLQAPAAKGDVDVSAAPVGWLVLIAGPGLGSAFQLSYGANRIGRGTGVEVALNFGDESISRGTHARVVYDWKGRIYYLVPGDGSSLTYMNGKPVLAPTEIDASVRIDIGHTGLKFVPLCGPAFDWMALAQGETTPTLAKDPAA